MRWSTAPSLPADPEQGAPSPSEAPWPKCLDDCAEREKLGAPTTEPRDRCEAAATAEQLLEHQRRSCQTKDHDADDNQPNEMQGLWTEAALLHNHCQDKVHDRRGSRPTNYVPDKPPHKHDEPSKGLNATT